MIKIRICHVTTVHPRTDVRIFYKECTSLAKEFDVYLIVADGLGNEISNNVNIIDIGLRQNSRIKRAYIDSKKALKKALELNCKIYHFHDPELIPLGLILKRKGFIVVADFHEDIPLQILTKHYVNPILKRILSLTFKIYQRYASKKMSAIVSATPTIAETLIEYNSRNAIVKNYPVLDSTVSYNGKKSNWITYIGGINIIRGFYEIIEASKESNTQLKIAGIFHEPILHDVIKKDEYSSNVDFLGFLNKSQVDKLLSESIAGLVTLHPTPNFLDSLPIKLFEYMSAGIPVIASNFPLWKKIIEGNECGICVDPFNSTQIAEAMLYLRDNPVEAKAMGDNGRKAVLEKYNWNNEEEKLIDLYNTILS